MTNPFFIYKHNLPYNHFKDLIYSLNILYSYKDITHIAFNCCKIDDNGLEIFTEYNRHITHLSIACCGTISEIGATALARDPLLKNLRLNSCYFGDTGIAHFATSTTLEALAVMFCNITPSGFSGFSINRTITELHLRGNTINESAAKELSSMKQLRILSADLCKLDDNSTRFLCSLPNLEELNLSDNSNITFLGILPLNYNCKIKNLFVNWTNVGDGGMSIISTMKHLICLEACKSNCSAIGAKSLANNQSIKYLNISFNFIGLEGATALFESKNAIKELNIACIGNCQLMPVIMANTSILYVYCDEPENSMINRSAPPFSEYRPKYSWDISYRY